MSMRLYIFTNWSNETVTQAGPLLDPRQWGLGSAQEFTDSPRPQVVLSGGRNDEYFMGTSHIDQLLGINFYEEDCYPKRRRKNHRYDDSDDYSDGPRYARKNPNNNLNKVEGLLEWKKILPILDMTVIYLNEKETTVPVQEINKVKTSKHIATENLAAWGDNLEAIFINIEWDKKGQTLKDFQQLKIDSTKLMAKGLVFVWAPKEYISDLLQIMLKKDFVYVQNLEIIRFDISKAIHAAEVASKTTFPDTITDIWPIVKHLQNINPVDLIADSPDQYFNRSKQTLLMFKKNNNLKFELRHQRTCDVVFDMPLKLGEKCAPDIKAYIYNMIETLLPECLVVQQKHKNEFAFKMMELWADQDQPRRGWIQVVQE